MLDLKDMVMLWDRGLLLPGTRGTQKHGVLYCGLRTGDRRFILGIFFLLNNCFVIQDFGHSLQVLSRYRGDFLVGRLQRNAGWFSTSPRVFVV